MKSRQTNRRPSRDAERLNRFARLQVACERTKDLVGMENLCAGGGAMTPIGLHVLERIVELLDSYAATTPHIYGAERLHLEKKSPTRRPRAPAGPHGKSRSAALRRAFINGDASKMFSGRRSA